MSSTKKAIRSSSRWLWITVCGLGVLLAAPPAAGVEQITFQRDGDQRHVAGAVQIEDQEGGVLLLSPDNTLWIIPQEEIVRRSADSVVFRMLTDEEMAKKLLDELPAGFRIHRTANYVICYNTSDAYAEWCGGLFERLRRGFYSYWKNRGMTLREPDQRLVALVFDGRKSFQKYSEPELGNASGAMMGYYNLRTNRVAMYDLTGADGLRGDGRRASSASHINTILSQPAAERTVATIVHEATHQLAYNSGLQTRYADIPAWVSEGIAVYFETPDLRSSKGWRGIGGLHSLHLNQFQRSSRIRTDDPLMTVLTDDARFRDPKTASQAYADAWALNYYLLRVRKQDYVDYLQGLAGQKPLIEVTGPERVARFRRAFGDDLEELSSRWQRYMLRAR